MKVTQTTKTSYVPPTSVPHPAVFGYASNHPEAITFNDFQAVRAEEMRGGFKKIKRITGYYHEKSVLGLEFIYELSTGQTVVTSHNCRHDNMMKGMIKSIAGKKIEHQTIDIPEGDYIATLQSCYNEKKIIYLMIATYRGSSVAFGYPRGDYVAISNPGFTFGPPKGGYVKKRLNYITFPAATLPDTGSTTTTTTTTTASIAPSLSISPPMPPPNVVNAIRSNSPRVGGRPFSPSQSSISSSTTTVIAPPRPPSSSGQIQEIEMKLSRLQGTSDPARTQMMQQSLLQQQAAVQAQLQQQQGQIQMQLQQLQQQQQLEIAAEMEKQQLLKLKQMELEKHIEQERIAQQQQELDALKMVHNFDQQKVREQQMKVEGLIRQQVELERMHQAQIAGLKTLQARQAQELEIMRARANMPNPELNVLRQQLTEQQELEKRQKMEMMAQLQHQINEQSGLELRQSGARGGTSQVMRTSGVAPGNPMGGSGVRPLAGSGVRPVSPNTLAVPGKPMAPPVPVGQAPSQPPPGLMPSLLPPAQFSVLPPRVTPPENMGPNQGPSYQQQSYQQGNQQGNWSGQGWEGSQQQNSGQNYSQYGQSDYYQQSGSNQQPNYNQQQGYNQQDYYNQQQQGYNQPQGYNQQGQQYNTEQGGYQQNYGQPGSYQQNYQGPSQQYNTQQGGYGQGNYQQQQNQTGTKNQQFSLI